MSPTFASNIKTNFIMKKLILLLAVVLLPQMSLSLIADNDRDAKLKIVLRTPSRPKNSRTVSYDSIEATYWGMMNTLQIMCPAGSGRVDVDVINCSTGETWCQSSDSAEAPVIYLLLSGTPGYYEVQLITEFGDVYEGEFLIE